MEIDKEKKEKEAREKSYNLLIQKFLESARGYPIRHIYRAAMGVQAAMLGAAEKVINEMGDHPDVKDSHEIDDLPDSIILNNVNSPKSSGRMSQILAHIKNTLTKG